ncbi:DMT family transporter [Thalassobacillus devorans]|uniref:DMT family transporter n=1 Tax=Thalassobacillus devorans TaxID=279813 RepID=UPI000A1C9D38|nr:DMT family transporter [Thalassobacillus devorans]
MNKQAFTLAFITVLIWGSTFAAIRASLHGGYTAGHLVLFRYLIASALFAIYALWPGVKFKLPVKKDVLPLLALGFVGISIYHTGVTFGEITVSSGTAGMLIGAAPIFTAIIAVIALKEKLGTFGWIGLGIGFVGILLITVGSSGSSFTLSSGAMLLVMATIATSIFFVFQKPFFRRYKPIELTAYVTWSGTIPFFIFSPGLFDTVQQASMEANLAAIYVGIFPAGVAYVTWSTALSLGNASSVTSMMYLEPAVAVFFGWVWLNELPSVLSLIGGAVALLGVITINVLGRRHLMKKYRTPAYNRNTS